jgi:Domain of unknown function (DUF4157)
MQTHVQAPAEQSQKQSQSLQQPAQLFAEPQTSFEDSRPSAAQLKTQQTIMGNSPQQQKHQGLQAKMNASCHIQKMQTLQTKMAAGTVAQREEEDEPLQAKLEDDTAQREAVAEAPKPNNTGLPENLKSGIESLSGMSMDHVKVHYNSSQPAQLNAHAYAQGSEIHVAPGQEQHLPHEAWHVVQQAQGRVRPTVQMKGDVPVNDDVGLESEADLIGGRALQMVAEKQNTRPDSISSTLQLQALASNYTKGLIPRSHNDTTTYPIQCMMNVTLETNNTDKKSLSAKGKVEDFDSGTSPGKKGWVGVNKYRASYKITSKDGKFEDEGTVGALKNSFTNPEAGHVLAKQNGGDGTDENNIFAQDGGTNNSIYKRFENEMRTKMNRYDATDEVNFKCYLAGNNITQGAIADEGLSDASSISSDEEASSSDEEMSASDEEASSSDEEMSS